MSSFNLITKASRLLVISPHADDEALGAGGLIGKAVKEKAKIFLLYIAIGESRQLVTKKTDSRQRLSEVKKVIKLTGAAHKIIFDGEELLKLDQVPQKVLIDLIEDEIEKFKPDIVALPSGNSYNQDHRAVHTAALAALRPIPNEIRQSVNFVLEFTEPYEWTVGNSFRNNLFLDLTEKFNGKNLFDFKLKLYRCYASQVRKDPFPRSPENLKRIAALSGKETGTKIAEGYKLLRLVV